MASHEESFAPDEGQQRIIDRVAAGGHGPLLVRGGPGTGKTATAAHLALSFLQRGHDSHELLVLSPSRTSSARLRDAVESRWARDPQQGTMTDQPSRSFASYAFRIIGEARRRGFLDLADRAPRLLSGAEQDREIAALLTSEETDIDWRVVDPATAGTDWEKVRADLREAVGTAGFRKEIRELFDRASEYGVSPEELRTWGQQAAAGDATKHPAWQPSGELYVLYLDVLGQQAPHAFDPSGLIARACDLLEDHDELLAAERERLGLIVVDDLQEANPNVLRLLRLIGAGGPVVAFANTEVAVQGFRGARPDLLANWAAAEAESSDDDRRGSMRGSGAGAEPEVLSLTGDHRMSAPVGEVYGRVVERIGVVGDSQEYLRRWRQLAIESRAELQTLAESAHDDDAPAQRASTSTGTGPHRNFSPDVETSALGVTVSIVGTEQHAEQMILQEVLERHHRGGPDGVGVPLGEIAVITRNGSAVHRISRLLASHGLPVTRSMSEVVLREESAVAPLLRIMRAVTGPEAEDRLDLPAVLALLAGPYGGVDAITLRRIRQRLLSLERTRIVEAGEDAVSPRSSDELLLDVVAEPSDPLAQRVAESEHRALRGLQRIMRTVGAARGAAAADSGAGPTDVLWALWTASGRQAPWVVSSEGGGEEARRANRDLDAVVALFEAAERYTEQLPGQSLHHFVVYIEEMELPMDTLAETSTVGDAISVLTPATAAGREFDTVILTGMQDGVWPNLTPRGELLGSSLLVDIVSGVGDPGSRSARAKRMQVLQDEFRLFAAAVSRTRHRLVGIGIIGTDETPSLLIDLLVPPVLRSSPELVRPRPMTAPSLVAALRRSLEAHHAEGDEAVSGGAEAASEEAEEAARALAILGRAYAEATGERIVGAAPQQWWGLIDPAGFGELVTDAELDGAEGPQVKLSPSSVAQAQSAPLAWFVDAVGGTAATDQARDLGTLIHSIAEDHPVPAPDASLRDTEETLKAVLAARWPELGLDPEGYESSRRFAEAEQMVVRLAWYLHASQDAGREHVLSEAQVTGTTELPIRGVLRPVTVSGKLDRLERDDEARYYIVDYKTGSSLPTRCSAHPHSGSRKEPSPDCDICRSVQLGLYQQLVRLPQERKTVRHADIDAPADGTAELSGAGHTSSKGLEALVGETSGAALLYVADPRTRIEGIEYIQRPVGEVSRGEDWPEGAEAWPDLALVDAAATVTGGYFAVHHAQGASCRAGTLCPICAGGRVVTQPTAE